MFRYIRIITNKLNYIHSNSNYNPVLACCLEILLSENKYNIYLHRSNKTKICNTGITTYRECEFA